MFFFARKCQIRCVNCTELACRREGSSSRVVARKLIAKWRIEYNTERPRSSLVRSSNAWSC
ncbi:MULTISPECIES: integrase core domain-containing protein [Ralstonia]|uniref:integrase core domain-containing protein n=1 Tax=Ralstonia TaxID=48736 RepID=UPI00126834F6|nr:transposase [Ralstonia insidiosa]